MCPLHFGSPVTDSPGNDPELVYVADFNVDHRPDIVVLYIEGGITSVLLGKDDRTFGEPQVVHDRPGSAPNSVAAGDLDRDGKNDIVVALRGKDTAVVFFGKGDGTSEKKQTLVTGTGSRPSGVSLGYFNGDKFLDLVVVCEHGDNAQVFLEGKNGQFGEPKKLPTGANSNPTSVIVGDYNGDGFQDFFASYYKGNEIGFFAGKGDEDSEKPVTCKTGDGPYTLAAAFLNRDKKTGHNYW